MWTFFNHIRAFLISLAVLTNILPKNRTIIETNEALSRNNTVTEVSKTYANVSFGKDHQLKNKKYRDFILRNTTKNSDGRIYILGLFELTTEYGKREHGWSEVGAARLAIEHINKMNFVRGHQLELLINDTMCDPGAGIDRYFHALYSKKIITMVLGSACSNVTESLASIVPYWNILQISFGSTSPALSDRRKFPLFFRTVTPDSSLNDVRFAVIKYYGWNTVATFSQRENAYILPLNSLVAKLEAAKIDCSTSITFSKENYKEQLKLLKVYHLGMYGSDYVWVLVERPFSFTKWTICPSRHVFTSLDGVITVAHYNRMPYDQKSISGLTNKDYSKLLNDTTYSKFAYDAVWTMALLLRHMQQKHKFNVSTFYYDQDEFLEHMLAEMENIKFMGASGPVSFKGADRVGDATVKQMQNGKNRVIAHFDCSNGRLAFKCDECVRIRWQGDAKPIAKRILKLRLDTIPKYAFYMVVIYSSLGLIVCIMFFYFNFHYRDNKVIKLSSPRLNNIAVLGCCLVFMAVILLGVDSGTLFDIKYFSQLCTTRVFLLSAGISMAFGSTFAKTYRIHRIFTYSCATKGKLLKDCRLIILVLMLVVIDAFVVTSWIFVDPLQRRLHNLTIEISTRDRSVLYQPQVEVCKCTNTTRWFIAMYGYKGFLLIMGVYMAWETRHIKVEALNDSQYIGVCVYSAVFSSLLVILSNFLTEYTLIAYLTQTASILTSTTLTLLLLFIPKLKAVVCAEQQEPIVPGLRIESNTRRFDVDDPHELTYRMLVQNKVYKCELDALDKEIARLENLLAKSTYQADRGSCTRASWPCVQIYNVSSKFLSQNQLDQINEGDVVTDHHIETDGRFFGKMLRGLLGRMYSISDQSEPCQEEEDEDNHIKLEFDTSQSEINYALEPHRFHMDIEEHI